MPQTARYCLIVPLILAGSIASALATNYTSAQSGDWNVTATTTWSPNGNPQTGSTDSISILTGHTVIFTGTSSVGLPNGSGDMGVANGNVISIDGGILSQTPPNYWIRIGQESTGTLNINDGRFHFTNSTATATPNFQIGIRGGQGFVNVGDGTGAAGSAVLNLRDIIDGTANGATVAMNLGATEGTAGLAGTLTVNSDGLFEGDTNGIIRIGQAATVSHAQSLLNVNGGQFNVHGNFEVGSNDTTGVGDRSNGAVVIQNGGVFTQDAGEVDLGYNGDASLTITNGTYRKVNAAGRGDIYVARNASSIATITIGDGGQFIRDAGGNVGDLRIGVKGTATMTINSGGLVENSSSNWDWIGQDDGSNGTVTINTGGTFRTTATGSANFNIGVNTGATGLVTVNGGTLELLGSANSLIRLAENGTGTFRQVSGATNVAGVQMAETNGNATFDLQSGSFTSRSSFFLGGATNASGGTGTATATMSGGSLTVGGAFVVGLAGGHTGTFTQTGGTITHTGSDITMGENGTGTMHISAGASLTDTSNGNFWVGRHPGSSGTLYVDGTVSRTATNALLVGAQDAGGVGVLGGTGTISVSNGGLTVGPDGTLTGGQLDTVGTLTLTGNLTFGSGGTLFLNFDGSGGVDRISLSGALDLGSSILNGSWTSGAPVGPSSRYWAVVNDGLDFISGSFSNLSLTSPSSALFPDANGFATIGGQEFAVYYSADFDSGALVGGNDLLLSAVPEPSSIALLAGAVSVLGLRRRRSA